MYRKTSNVKSVSWGLWSWTPCLNFCWLWKCKRSLTVSCLGAFKATAGTWSVIWALMAALVLAPIFWSSPWSILLLLLMTCTCPLLMEFNKTSVGSSTEVPSSNRRLLARWLSTYRVDEFGSNNSEGCGVKEIYIAIIDTTGERTAICMPKKILRPIF